MGMSFLYGGDYNPEQWMKSPEILDQDIELMKKAGCNVMSVGIFGWSVMEPREGEYDFSFYETIINRLYENGIQTILATPSAAVPAWLTRKYPEVLQTDYAGRKHKHGNRQNYCFTSPVYREKVRAINTQLASKFKDNPAIYAIHVSNEYGGECHCELCAQAFREYLKKRYDNDLDKLNDAWWNTFWSHSYTDWDEIEPPSEIGEYSSNALKLNWRRFVSDQTMDFYKNEIEPFRQIAPHLPITTNFHGVGESGLDYFKFAELVDFTCWDAYPKWHSPEGNLTVAASVSFIYDMCRSMKQKPFLLMESTPSCVNWMDCNKLKRPGMNMLSSLQAIADGADSVQYFQWRKSRGSAEKLHGAVVDHCGHENTRVFREAAALGQELKKLSEIQGSQVQSPIAVLFDYENSWALKEAEGFQKKDKKYLAECIRQYSSFWKNGYNTDVIDSSQDFSRYRIVVAPMLYMMKNGVAERLCQFVNDGGILVSGFMTGYVDEDDLCYLGGFPAGELKELFGIWNEEIDTLYPEDQNRVRFAGKDYRVSDYCEIIHANTAEVLATYQDDFYAGTPAVTVHNYGKGKAYYVACRAEDAFLDSFLCSVAAEIPSAREEITFPEGVTVRTRENETGRYYFVQNWTEDRVNINLKSELHMVESGQKHSGQITMEPYQTLVYAISPRHAID